MDELAGKETEWDEGLYKKDGRCYEAAIGQKTGETIQQCKIFRLDSAMLRANCERMGEAATEAAPESSPDGVHGCEYIVHR